MSGERVVLLVGSDVTADARVLKGAETLRRAGYDTHILFTAKGSGPYPTHIDGTPTEFVAVRPVASREPALRRFSDLARVGSSRGGFASSRSQRIAVQSRKLHERRVAARIASRKVALRELPPARSLVGRVMRKLRATLLKAAIRADRELMARRRAILRHRIARTPTPTRDRPFTEVTDLRPRREDLRRDWRTALPDLAELELAFGPRIDALAPDIIHAHDHHLLPAAVEAAQRARAAGRRIGVIYDAHEYVRGLTTLADDRRRALAAMEQRFVPRVDHVITVSPQLAARLVEDHGIDAPTVVLNTPRAADATPASATSVRDVVGVPADHALLVYSGNVTPARGVDTIIEALPQLDDHVHLALVVGVRVPYIDQLLERAAKLQVGHRVHLAPYVRPDEVATYLRSATVGIHPLRRYPNSEIALPNKLFEYLQASLPVIVSDCPAQAGFVREQGLGEVFEAEAPGDLARAVRRVLADPAAYEAAAAPLVRHTFSWEGQEPALLELYRRAALDVSPAA